MTTTVEPGYITGLLDEHLQHCIADAAVLEGPRADQRLDEASAAIARLVRS
jgi:DNA-binding FrmR family transcriptional regulator